MVLTRRAGCARSLGNIDQLAKVATSDGNPRQLPVADLGDEHHRLQPRMRHILPGQSAAADRRLASVLLMGDEHPMHDQIARLRLVEFKDE
jgi:hypothetical protein